MTAGARPYCGFLDTEHDRRILQLWRAGNDTVAIAKTMCCAEADIANRLPHILEASRNARSA